MVLARSFGENKSGAVSKWIVYWAPLNFYRNTWFTSISIAGFWAFELIQFRNHLDQL